MSRRFRILMLFFGLFVSSGLGLNCGGDSLAPSAEDNSETCGASRNACCGAFAG